jgi:CBS-domain-containing membrane protein
MTPDVKYCFEDDEVGAIVKNMAEIKVQRLPVMNRDKRLVGIVSLATLRSRPSQTIPTRRSAASRSLVGLIPRMPHSATRPE